MPEQIVVKAPDKKWWQSKTIIGIILTIVGLVLRKHGIEIPTEVLYGTGGLAAYGLRDSMGKITT